MLLVNGMNRKYILDGNDAIACIIGDGEITFTYEESNLPKEFRDILKNGKGHLVLVDASPDDELSSVFDEVNPVAGYGIGDNRIRYVFNAADLIGAKDVKFGSGNLISITYKLNDWKCV